MLDHRYYIMGMDNSFDSLAEIAREGSKPSQIGFIIKSIAAKIGAGAAIGAGFVLVMAIARAASLVP